MKKVLPIFILLLVGLAVLGGYIFPDALSPILNLLIDWGILLIGTAGLVGIGYLIKRHVDVITRKQKRSFLSIILLSSFLITLVINAEAS